MTDVDGYGDALRAIIEEAAAARSALCENELVIRLDNILAIARAALEEQRHDATFAHKSAYRRISPFPGMFRRRGVTPACRGRS